VDYHRKRMGLNQQFNSIKTKKEKRSRFSNSVLDSKVNMQSNSLWIILLFVMIIVSTALYSQLHGSAG